MSTRPCIAQGDDGLGLVHDTSYTPEGSSRMHTKSAVICLICDRRWEILGSFIHLGLSVVARLWPTSPSLRYHISRHIPMENTSPFQFPPLFSSHPRTCEAMHPFGLETRVWHTWVNPVVPAHGKCLLSWFLPMLSFLLFLLFAFLVFTFSSAMWVCSGLYSGSVILHPLPGALHNI